METQSGQGPWDLVFQDRWPFCCTQDTYVVHLRPCSKLIVQLVVHSKIKAFRCSLSASLSRCLKTTEAEILNLNRPRALDRYQ